MTYDFKAQRLFVHPPLGPGARIALDRAQANYLVNVLRMKDGGEVLVFNGRDGEWRARLVAESRKTHSLLVADMTRRQPGAATLHYLFAPLKQARLDYMVEKAVEMGVGRLRPVLTQHTQVRALNRDRAKANAVEAAEQCGILTLPEIDPPVALGDLLDRWEAEEGRRHIVFCDERHGGGGPLAVLARLTPSPLAVLVGPGGGLTAEERRSLLSRPFVTVLPLGHRILRADTAAVAALALVQAACGDWR